MQPRSLKRTLAASLAVCAVAPATAVAVPLYPVAMPQSPAAPDHIDRGPGAVHRATAAQSSDDDGVSIGVIGGVGGAALVLVGGVSLASRARLRIARQRQLA
jgi:hypothetical protein